MIGSSDPRASNGNPTEAQAGERRAKKQHPRRGRHPGPVADQSDDQGQQGAAKDQPVAGEGSRGCLGRRGTDCSTSTSPQTQPPPVTRPSPRPRSLSPRSAARTAVTPTLPATITSTRNNGSCRSATTLPTKPTPSRAKPGEVRQLGDDADHATDPGRGGGAAGTDRLQDRRHPVRQAGDDGGDPAHQEHDRISWLREEGLFLPRLAVGGHSASGLLLLGSTGTPGPIVVEMVAFFR